MKKFRAIGIAVLSIILSLWLAPAEAMERTKFSADAFAAAQRENRPILIEVHAWWCPVCWMQKSAMSSLETEARFKGLIAFSVDYDQDKAILRKFNVQKQSTMIVFKGGTEVGRSVGESNTSALSTLLERGERTKDLAGMPRTALPENRSRRLPMKSCVSHSLCGARDAGLTSTIQRAIPFRAHARRAGGSPA